MIPPRPALVVSTLGAGFVFGLALGAAAGTSRDAEPPAPAAAEARPAPSPRTTRPQAPVEAPAPPPPAQPDDEACTVADAVCDAHMRSIGCTPPIAFPDDLPEGYDAASVQAAFEELRGSCGPFADNMQQVDCSEYPCLLFMRPPPASGDWSLSHEERVAAMGRWPGEVTCGRHGPAKGLNLKFADGWRRPGTEVESHVYAIYPHEKWPHQDMYARVKDRVLSYTVEEMEALDAR